MSKMNHAISELLDGLDTIRPIVLAANDKNAELRSLLRRMLSLLETLQRTPNIEPALYTKVLSMLGAVFDAEHGALIKRMHDADASDVSWDKFDAHLKERKVLIDAAQQDLPAALTTIQRGCDLLGKPHPETDNLTDNFNAFERYLREYLRGNAKVRQEFNLLTSALKDSVKAMDGVLGEVGEESPELKQVQLVLEQDLPSDPEEAQILLRKARNEILKAGKTLTHASQQVKATMTAQVEQMNSLSKRLEHAEAQARNDPLTGLGNRRKLREYFADLPDNMISVFIMIDIDHFKQLNDKYGHDSGDYILEKLGYLLKVAVRSTDMVARLGGEEFCIVLPGTDAAQGTALAETIRKDVQSERFNTHHGNIDVKVSIGVSERMPDEPINNWVKRADEALYHSKHNGRNQVTTAGQYSK